MEATRQHVDYILKISRLCMQTLEKKWNAGSLFRVSETCPFCWDANLVRGKNKGDICTFCCCPSEICSFHGSVGLIREIQHGHGKEFLVKDLPRSDLEKMRAALEKHVIKIDT